MRIYHRVGLWLIVCPLLLTLSAAKPTIQDVVQAAPVETVRGTWRGDLSDTQGLILRFEKDLVELSVETDGKLSPLQKGRLSFPKEHADRHLDWVDLQAGGNPLPDNLCLYRVAGDTLLIIGGGPSSRPTRFYTGSGGEPRTLVLTRITEPAKVSK